MARRPVAPGLRGRSPLRLLEPSVDARSTEISRPGPAKDLRKTDLGHRFAAGSKRPGNQLEDLQGELSTLKMAERVVRRTPKRQRSLRRSSHPGTEVATSGGVLSRGAGTDRGLERAPLLPFLARSGRGRLPAKESSVARKEPHRRAGHKRACGRSRQRPNDPLPGTSLIAVAGRISSGRSGLCRPRSGPRALSTGWVSSG